MKKILLACFLLGVFLYSCNDQGTRFSLNKSEESIRGSGLHFDVQAETNFDQLLQKYVVMKSGEKSVVKYKDWIKSPNDLKILNDVLEAMANADDTIMSLNEKKAFYINAYNAVTLQLILSNYSKLKGYDGGILNQPPEKGKQSIRNIDNSGNKIWDLTKRMISSQEKSLNDIEHKILRTMGDPRIHFSIVCASRGCPSLCNQAFTEKNVNPMLDALASEFVNTGMDTKFESNTKTIETSQILNWFGSDFVSKYGSVKDFFKTFVTVIPPSEVANYKIQFSSYDWSLNQPKADDDSSDGGGGGSGTENNL